ncbi:unnamed protein product [Lupinus luteus]|uniref:DEAD/DEAH-box helicase domain-containing protein n=1 Tax=Lupinus luteus TaxID=3873 RepID=A0AAV1YMB1_LUPLU
MVLVYLVPFSNLFFKTVLLNFCLLVSKQFRKMKELAGEFGNNLSFHKSFVGFVGTITKVSAHGNEGCAGTVMQGRDMIGGAITGTGKTLACGIPIMDKIIQVNDKHGLVFSNDFFLLNST